MPQVPADKTFFTFAGGINTEVSPLAFPDGVSLSEENMELLLNGSRRRRKGLRREEGQDQLALGYTPSAASEYTSFVWRNVAGDPNLTYIVVQLGSLIHFFEDGETITDGKLVGTISLALVNTTDGAEDISEYPFVFAANEQHLFVTSRYTKPVYIEHNPAAGTFTLNTIDIRIRDFVGIDDGVPITNEPTTLSDNHRYNLQNRGWTDSEISAYFTDVGRYPSKVQVSFAGYRRATVAGYSELDGTQEFSAAKLDAEVFGNSSAPQGAFLQDPFDTSTGFSGSSEEESLGIATWDFIDAGSTWTVTITTVDAHGFSPSDEATIVGNTFLYDAELGGFTFEDLPWSWDGTHTILSTPSATEFTFSAPEPSFYTNMADQFENLGVVDVNVVVISPGFVQSTDERPKACAVYASRVFYAGVSEPHLSDRVFFSQIILDETQYGKCYQEADPTSPTISELIATDGGVIQVPGLGDTMKMVPFGTSLFIFAKNGVWEIGPSGDGYFAATGYSVRKLTDVEALDPNGIAVTDFGIIFTSRRGLFVLTQDSNSGYWTAQSISEQTVQTLWNSLPDIQQRRTMVRYDDAKKRVYFFYTETATDEQRRYERALVFDLRLSAFYKLLFPTSATDYICGVVAIDSGDAAEQNNKLKFFVYRDTRTALDICDMNHTTFEDFDGGTQNWEIVTGYDNVGDFMRFRQAPVIHIFMSKTETGYFEDGEGSLTPVNESLVYFQALWDWVDHPNSGKYGAQYQVYKHRRNYIPEDSSDGFDNGHPVVVSRIKVRGRGRALHLRFSGGEDKDAHLLGWAIHYKGTGRI